MPNASHTAAMTKALSHAVWNGWYDECSVRPARYMSVMPTIGLSAMNGCAHGARSSTSCSE